MTSYPVGGMRSDGLVLDPEQLDIEGDSENYDSEDDDDDMADQPNSSAAAGTNNERARSLITTTDTSRSSVRDLADDPDNAIVQKARSKKKKKKMRFRTKSLGLLSDAGRSDGDSVVTLPRTGSRLPFHNESRVTPSHRNESRASLMSTRYRYYGRLDPRAESVFRMPDHVVPESYFVVLPLPKFLKEHGQTSIITIFSIWNTMMGTSLLSMPWALQQAGLFFGIFLMMGMAAISFYTAFRVVQSPNGLPLGSASAAPEFSDVCRFFFGKWGDIIATVFSVIVLFGGVMVYWVLMSNFLFYTGAVIHDALLPNSTELIILANRTLQCDVSCIGKDVINSVSGVGDEASLFYKFWGLRTTVPLYLAIIAYPLLNFRSPTFFTKFNVFGTVSVFYLLIFVTVKAFQCGWHIDLSDRLAQDFTRSFNWNFPSLTGTLALSYFIHNAIMAILRNQKNPENNVRDLAIGYGLSAVTYIYIGFAFYVSFPLYKSCIADNFLNNYGTGDVLSAVARLFLLFQMMCVLPLLMYIIRAQMSNAIIGNVYPGLKWVMLLNGTILCACILVAIFLPTVGTIIRFTGSISGLVYIFTLPCLVYMKREQMEDNLTWKSIALHVFIIGLGVANLVGQFLVL